MSNRWPQIHDPNEGQRGQRMSPRARYLPSSPGSASSPILTIVLILAAFTCLFLCIMLMLITFKLIFPV